MYKDKFYLNSTGNVIRLISNFCKKNKNDMLFFFGASHIMITKYCQKIQKKILYNL